MTVADDFSHECASIAVDWGISGLYVARLLDQAAVDECLNEQGFETAQQARLTIAVWRQDFIEVRPHGSCGRIPPAKFSIDLTTTEIN